MATRATLRFTTSAATAAALFLGAAPVRAAGPTFDLPARITIETDQSEATPSNPDYCYAAGFVIFPAFKNAVRYEVVWVDRNSDTETRRIGPSFFDDTHTRHTVPKGFHWWSLTTYSHRFGCAHSISMIEGRFEVVRARVTMNKRFRTNLKKPVDKCKSRDGGVIGRPPVLGRQGDQLLLIRRGGEIAHHPDGSPGENINLLTNVYVTGPTIIETGTDGVLKIAQPNGESILVGPGMTIKVEAGKPVTILEHTPGLNLDDIPKANLDNYKVRSPGCGMGAQG